MRSLLASRSGAVMVMSVFFAIFLVAILYHVIGVGGAALEQQILQDAADAAVFSAATANARGMNMLVLINLIMVLALAVLVALRLVQALLTVGTAIVTALCIIPWTSAAGCPLVTPLADATVQVTDLVDQVEDAVGELLEGLNSAADEINQIIPYLAEAEAIYVSAQDVYDPAQVGFVWPVFDELPTKDGTFDTLCHRAGEEVVNIAFCYFPDAAKEVLGDLVGGLATTFSEYFCGGDGGGDPPRTEEKINKSYPAENDDGCRPQGDSWEGGPSTGSGCDNDEGTTDGSSCDCDGNDQCLNCSPKGCHYCMQFIAEVENGLWTVRRDRWREKWESDGNDGNGAWKFDEWLEEDRRWLKTEDGDPCRGAQARNGCTGGSAYSPRMESAVPVGGRAPSLVPAVCIFEEQTDERWESARARGDHYREMERISYLYLHSCEIPTYEPIVAQGDPIEGSEDRVPRELDMETYPELSKMRSVVLGGGSSSKRMEGVNFAAQEKADGAFSERFSVAAAEYYSPNDDLWSLNWTTRFIRFRLSYDDSGEGESADFGSGVDGAVGGSGEGASGGGAGSSFGSEGGGFLDSCMEGFENECGAIQENLGSSGESFGDKLGGMGGLSDFGGDQGGGFDVENLIAH